MLKEYNQEKDILTIKCDCGAIFESDSSSFVATFNEEFGQYENYHADCPDCQATHVLNLSIPVGEFDELEFEFYLMPFEEINARKYLRDFIWNKRGDLANEDRNALYTKQYNLMRGVQ